MPRTTDLRMFVAAGAASISVRRAQRTHRDLGALLAAVEAKAVARGPRRWWGAASRVPVVVRWCFRFDDRSCVGRSLTAFALLRRQGEMPSFVSGVIAQSAAETDRRLDGHAWVELDGVAVGAADRALAGRFREIYRYPTAREH